MTMKNGKLILLPDFSTSLNGMKTVFLYTYNKFINAL